MGQATQHRCTVSLPGAADAPGKARTFVTEVLGPGQDDITLVVSELVTNAVRHSRSGAPGGQVAIAIEPGRRGEPVLVEVTDAGTGDGSQPPGHARMPGPESLPEGGMGLALVSSLSLEWGRHAAPGSTCYWARMAPE